MTFSLDNWLSGRYQACALNYNYYIKKLFGDQHGLDNLLAFSIQFADLSLKHGGKKQDGIIPQNLPVRFSTYLKMTLPFLLETILFSRMRYK